MNMQPTRDRVIVKVRAKEEKSSSGLFVVNEQQETTLTADVIAVGPGAKTRDGVIVPTTVQVGDCVLFPKNLGHKIKADGEEFVILLEEEIFAIMQ